MTAAHEQPMDAARVLFGREGEDGGLMVDPSTLVSVEDGEKRLEGGWTLLDGTDGDSGVHNF